MPSIPWVSRVFKPNIMEAVLKVTRVMVKPLLQLQQLRLQDTLNITITVIIITLPNNNGLELAPRTMGKLLYKFIFLIRLLIWNFIFILYLWNPELRRYLFYRVKILPWCQSGPDRVFPSSKWNAAPDPERISWFST